jgi:hypothetical protein
VARASRRVNRDRFLRDAWADFQGAHDELRRDPEASFSTGYDLRRQVLVSHQLSRADHDHLFRRTSAIRTAVSGITTTSTPDPGAFAGYSPATTDPAFSLLALAAATGLPLWCDDVALRALARQHGIAASGPPSCCTPSPRLTGSPTPSGMTS